MADKPIKTCVICGEIFAAADASLTVCSKPCGLTRHKRQATQKRQLLKQSDFAAKLRTDSNDHWRRKLREFRLANNIKLREMAILFGSSRNASSIAADWEGGRRPMTPARRLYLQALIDGYRPSNYDQIVTRRRPKPRDPRDI